MGSTNTPKTVGAPGEGQIQKEGDDDVSEEFDFSAATEGSLRVRINFNRSFCKISLFIPSSNPAFHPCAGGVGRKPIAPTSRDSPRTAKHFKSTAGAIEGIEQYSSFRYLPRLRAREEGTMRKHGYSWRQSSLGSPADAAAQAWRHLQLLRPYGGDFHPRPHRSPPQTTGW
jgi:hypothetical protein